MSDGRWSISNLARPISYKQFLSLTKAFQEAAERSFRTPTKITVAAMNGIKSSSTIPDPTTAEFTQRMNKERTFLETEDLSEVTKDVWDKAKFVEVSIRPVDKSKAQTSALAHVEFKGLRPSQATFYIQCGDNLREVRDAVLRTRPITSRVGDGYKSNGNVSLH